MICALRAFLEFCYLAQQNSHNVNSLKDMDNALSEFHKCREVFVESGIRTADSWPPRQHSAKHYVRSIREFGSPNGLCSSITESKHIDAVKKPWRRSNRCNALNQILITNDRLDKLQAARAYFQARGMLCDVSSICNRNINSREEELLSGKDTGNAEDDAGAVVGSTVVGSVVLATAARESPL